MSGKPINPSGYKFPPNTTQHHNGGYYGKGSINTNPVRRVNAPPVQINSSFKQTMTRITTSNSNNSGGGGCSSCGH